MAAASAGALPMMMISAAAPSAAAVAAVDDLAQIQWGRVGICTLLLGVLKKSVRAFTVELATFHWTRVKNVAFLKLDFC